MIDTIIKDSVVLEITEIHMIGVFLNTGETQ